MALITRRKKPNPKLDKFLALCARGLTAKDAGLAAGYAESTAEEYKTRYKDQIKDLALGLFTEYVPAAIKTIAEVMQDSAGGTRIAAANRMLEGAGAGIVHKSEVTHKTDQQIDDELRAACGGDDAKVAQLVALLRQDQRNKAEGVQPTVH